MKVYSFSTALILLFVLNTNSFAQKAANPKIVYLKTDEFNSVDDLIRQFRGNYIYVDIWATWCKPCFVEFASNSKVKESTEGKPFKLLYISIDRSKHESRWKRRIEKYNLLGYHVIANRELQKDLWRMIHNQDTRVEIPRYLIIDKDGNLRIKNAARPSQSSILKSQIEDLIAESE